MKNVFLRTKEGEGREETLFMEEYSDIRLFLPSWFAWLNLK